MNKDRLRLKRFLKMIKRARRHGYLNIELKLSARDVENIQCVGVMITPTIKRYWYKVTIK